MVPSKMLDIVHFKHLLPHVTSRRLYPRCTLSDACGVRVLEFTQHPISETRVLIDLVRVPIALSYE